MTHQLYRSKRIAAGRVRPAPVLETSENVTRSVREWMSCVRPALWRAIIGHEGL